MRLLAVLLVSCGATPSPVANVEAPRGAAQAFRFDDGATCPPAPRAELESCLSEHGFCARDVNELEHGLRDLVVVSTSGAVDCAGYYLLAASGGTWSPIAQLHARRHHDPTHGDLAVIEIRDGFVAGRRTTRIAYTLELVSESDESVFERWTATCVWPAAGWPHCESKLAATRDVVRD